MKKITVALCIALVGCISSAVMSVSASAQPPKCEPTPTIEQFRYCGTLNSTELELLTGVGVDIRQETTPTHQLEIQSSVPTVVSCAEGSGEGAVEEETFTITNMTYTECGITSTNKTECAVTSTIEETEVVEVFSLQTELEGSVEGLRLDMLLRPKVAGGTFATFSIFSTEGHTCADAQENGKLKGEVLCFFLEPIETDELEHLYECPAAGSALTYAGNATTVSFEDSVLILLTPTEDTSWSIVQGL